jgi:hypothetical protein
MEIALTVHSKARVVLQYWALLIMRRRVDARHEKDALYDRLQNTTVGPQEKVLYWRGAMLLCHLLIERDQAESHSLLDRYLVDFFFFPWSAAVKEKDASYLQADVVHWVRQAGLHVAERPQDDRGRVAEAEPALVFLFSHTIPAAPPKQEDVAMPCRRCLASTSCSARTQQGDR